MAKPSYWADDNEKDFDKSSQIERKRTITFGFCDVLDLYSAELLQSSLANR